MTTLLTTYKNQTIGFLSLKKIPMFSTSIKVSISDFFHYSINVNCKRQSSRSKVDGSQMNFAIKVNDTWISPMKQGVCTIRKSLLVAPLHESHSPAGSCMQHTMQSSLLIPIFTAADFRAVTLIYVTEGSNLSSSFQ